VQSQRGIAGAGMAGGVAGLWRCRCGPHEGLLLVLLRSWGFVRWPIKGQLSKERPCHWLVGPARASLQENWLNVWRFVTVATVSTEGMCVQPTLEDVDSGGANLVLYLPPLFLH
jgi:hypothetical protein